MLWVAILVIGFVLIWALYWLRQSRLPTNDGTIRSSFFYKTVLNEQGLCITFTKTPFLYWIVFSWAVLLVGSFIMQILPDWPFYLFAAIALPYIFFAYFAHLKPNRMIKEAASKGAIIVTGSKFSFSNPLRVIITGKNTAEQGVAPNRWHD
jgi:hypothetical protein